MNKQNSLNIISFMNDVSSYTILTLPAVFGVFTNAINIAVFLNPKLKGAMYDYLLWKSILDFLIEVIGCFVSIVFCENCLFYNSVASYIYDIYLFTYFYYVLYGCTTICELAIAYDRILILKHNPKRYWFQSIKYFIPIIIGFFFLITVPLSLAFVIVPVTNSSYFYTRIFSNFGQSIYYKFYLFFIHIHHIHHFLLSIDCSTQCQNNHKFSKVQ